MYKKICIYFHYFVLLLLLFSLHQYFQYIPQLIYQLTFLYTCNFPSLNTLQITWYITFIFTINWIAKKPLITFYFINWFFTLTSAFITIGSLLSFGTLASNLHLHLQVSGHIMSLGSLILGIRLDILMFMFLTTIGTHVFEYGSLLLLQLLLHFFILTL